MRVLFVCVTALALLMAQAVYAGPLFTADESRPADAVILFDGKGLSGWTTVGTDQPAAWKVENGYMEVTGGNIATRQQFGSYQLHLEFWLPLMKDSTGQGRANSGVYLHSRYEVQVLDSYGLNSQWDDCGGIYRVAAPLVNACRPPERWQAYDILFRAPIFDKDGRKLANARLTVLQNGVLIHRDVEVPDGTIGAIGDERPNAPLMLQDHGCKVRYRNIWLRPLK